MLPGLHLISSNTELNTLAAMRRCSKTWEVNGRAVPPGIAGKWKLRSISHAAAKLGEAQPALAGKLCQESETLACRFLPAEEERWKG